MTTPTTCSICVENFNATKNKPIVCLYCDFQACKKCCETYILGETVEKCMNTACGKPWTRKMMTDQFTHTFLNGPLKNHKKNLLFERERGMLPATQAIVEEEIRKEKIEKMIGKNNEEMRTQSKEWRISYGHCLQDIRDIRYLLENTNSILMIIPPHENLIERNEHVANKKKELRARLEVLLPQSIDLEKKIRVCERKYTKIRNDLKRELGGTEVTRKTFVRACPDTDCRGFLSSQWKCGLCDKWTCPDCHVLKGPGDHTCNPDDVATATLLANDTKPCPKCKTGIFKIDGCDQMFCTQCHTGFSWKTGNIETRIHNPHYFEWMRRNRDTDQAERNPLEIICGREIDGHFTVNLINSLGRRNLSELYTRKILNIARSINHLTEVILPQYAVNDVADNQDLRVKFMRNQINENEFKTHLLKRVKTQDKKREYRDVLVMFQNTMIDMLYRYRNSLEFNEDYTSYLQEVDALVYYVNECFWTISRTFSCALRELTYQNNYDLLSCSTKPKPKTKDTQENTIMDAIVANVVAPETTYNAQGRVYYPHYLPNIWQPVV